MPGQRPIRIRRKDRELINRLNQRVRSKIYYLEKTYNVSVDVEIRNIQSFKTRAEFNRYVEQMERFTRRNANQFDVITSKGVRISGIEFNRARRLIQRVNIAKSKEFSKYKDQPFTFMGKPMKDRRGKTLTVGNQWFGMGDQRFQFYKPIELNFDWFESKADFQRWLRNTQKAYRGDFIRRGNTVFKNNYIVALENIFGSQASDIVEHLLKMDESEIVAKGLSENYANINFIYDPVDAKQKLQILRKVWGVGKRN